MSDEIRLPKPEYGTPPGVQHHVCEHEGCAKDAGWGFAKPKQAPHWFCFEHRQRESTTYSWRPTMSRHDIAADLENAANQIAEVSRADLQVMLRRAALMLRNVTGLVLEPSVHEPLSNVAEEMGLTRADLIRTIVSDWLVANAYLPVPYALDEDSTVEGNA